MLLEIARGAGRERLRVSTVCTGPGVSRWWGVGWGGGRGGHADQWKGDGHECSGCLLSWILLLVRWCGACIAPYDAKTMAINTQLKVAAT